MANKIRIDGTTANSFQIGKTGDGDLQAASITTPHDYGLNMNLGITGLQLMVQTSQDTQVQALTLDETNIAFVAPDIYFDGNVHMNGGTPLIVNGGSPGEVLSSDGAGSVGFKGGFVEKSTTSTLIPVYTYSGSPQSSSGSFTIVFNNTNDATTFLNDRGTEITFNDAGATQQTYLITGISNKTIDTVNVTFDYSSSISQGSYTGQSTADNSVLIQSGTLYLSPISLSSDIANVKITGGASGQVLSTDGLGNVSFQSGFTSVVTGSSTMSVQITTGYYAGHPDINLGAGLAIRFSSIEDATRFINNPNDSFNFLDGMGDSTTSTNSVWVISGVTNKFKPFQGDDTYVQIYWTSSQNIGSYQGNINIVEITETTPSETILSPTTLTADIANTKITGGASGQVLSTDGSGNLTWTTPTSGGGGNLIVSTRSGTYSVTISSGGGLTVATRSGDVTVNIN